MRGEGDMEESIESSCADGEIEISDPFENFLENTFLPQTQSGESRSTENLPKKVGESTSVVEVNDPFQTYLQGTFIPQSSGSEDIKRLSQPTKKRHSSRQKPDDFKAQNIHISPIFDERESPISVPDPFQQYLQNDFLLQSLGQLNDSSTRTCSQPQMKKRRLSTISSTPRYAGAPSEISMLPLFDHDSDSDDNQLPQAKEDSDSINFDDIIFNELLSYEENGANSSEQFTEELTSDDKLYTGASITQFQAISMLTSWFALHPGISKTAFDRLLYLLHTYILPIGNSLPKCYGEVKSALHNFLTPTKEYHCCINDCVVFRDTDSVKYADLQQCPICGEPRYKSGSDNIPQKRFIHLPLETRIRRMFSHTETARLFQQHAAHEEGSSTQSKMVSTIHETNIWKGWYSSGGIYDGDQRAVSFGMCTDGVNPFAAEKVNYSMWPIVLFPLNFPAHVRKLSSSMMLVGIIPGPKEMLNIDPYLDIVVDDVTALNGVEMYDAYNGCVFKLKATVLLHVLDYPGQNKVFHCQGAGAYSGCAYCCQQGEYCKALNKMVYLHHRRFLPTGDPLRVDTTNFPHKEVCTEVAPDVKTQRYIDNANDAYEALDTAKARTEKARSTGCVGSYALHALEHHDRPLSTPVEPMHLIKCISEHIVKLISGGEDSAKVRNEEKKRLRFRSSWPIEIQAGSAIKTSLPSAPFRLSKSDMKIANQRALGIRTPHGTDFNAQLLFSEKIRMKSVQWKHVVASGVLKYCIRGLLGSFQCKTLMELCNVLSMLVAEEIDMSCIDNLEYRTHRVLALLERDFPVSLNVIVFHLLHHLPVYLRRFGPAYTFWMYPLERFNSWIGRRVHNRRYPEATVIETYRLFEFSAFLSLAKLLPRDSIADIDSIDNQAPENEVYYPDSDKKQCLDDEMFESLLHFYREQQSQTCISETVSADELSGMEQCPENVIMSRSFLTKVDSHGRHIRYSPYSPKSKHSSCIVYMHSTVDKRVMFGDIKMAFQHKFCGITNSLVYVQWFEKFSRDMSSSLIFINTSETTPHMNPIVHISDLSKPLIHAYDNEEEGKLWILNAPLSF